MSVDPDTFRSALGRFASGVTVVTTRDAAGRDHGLTVSAFCSLSLDPPLVLVCIDKDASMHPVLDEASHFAVNILAANQEALARRFAAPETDRFDGIGYVRDTTGAPILDDVLAYVECRKKLVLPGGDHTIVIGEVEHVEVHSTGPLLYYRGGYAQLER
jgi:flavin reductase (DIM6/NTAB) family NADH-FMN oxidoreductase RutF